MKLEVGKYYKTRDGLKVGPIELSYEAVFPFRCKSHYGGFDTYLEDGRLYGHRESIYDLVEEWKDEPKLWKDMTDEEKGALLLAYHEGKTIEFYTMDTWWLSVGRPDWLDHVAYRVKTQPVVEQDWISICRNGRDYKITFDTINGEPDCSSVKMVKV